MLKATRKKRKVGIVLGFDSYAVFDSSSGTLDIYRFDPRISRFRDLDCHRCDGGDRRSVIALETSDNMTDPQIVAKVRNYFLNRNAEANLDYSAKKKLNRYENDI